MPSDFVIVPNELTSVLSAVNVLITSLGETPLTTIDPPPTSEADQALLAVNQADLSVQTQGWKWNREFAYPLALDGDGKVALPDQTLQVVKAYWDTSSNGVAPNFVQRGPYLYNMDDHTDVFEAAPTVDLVVRLGWDLLPEAARQYITRLACLDFQAGLQDRPVKFRVTEAMVKRSRATLEQHEDAISGFNAIQNNIGVQSGLHGTGGLRRNRRGLS